MNRGQQLDPESVITWISSLLASSASQVVAGATVDDCAVIRWPQGGLLVISTDFVNARPIVTDMAVGSLFDVGRIVVANNLSDLCGSGARPLGLLSGVMAPRDTTLDQFHEVMEGIKHQARECSVSVVGGDTKLGDFWAIYGVAVGYVETEQNLFLKTRARPGDDLWISGPVGDCCAAVVSIEDEKEAAWIHRAIAEPTLPLGLSEAVSALKASAAGTDISDGLASNLLDLCRSSSVAAEVWADDIPVSDNVKRVAARHGIPRWALGLILGGDFQFIVTADTEFRHALSHLGLVRIGKITTGPDSWVVFEDRRMRLPNLGHRDGRRLPFRNEVKHLLDLLKEALSG